MSERCNNGTILREWRITCLIHGLISAFKIRRLIKEYVNIDWVLITFLTSVSRLEIYSFLLFLLQQLVPLILKKVRFKKVGCNFGYEMENTIKWMNVSYNLLGWITKEREERQKYDASIRWICVMQKVFFYFFKQATTHALHRTVH